MGAPLRLDGVERIAVLRANAIGDFVFALPALEALKAAYPGARLTLLARGWHRAFLEGRPGPVDEVVVVPGDGRSEVAVGGRWADAPWLAAWPDERAAFFEAMRARAFDLAVQLHGGGRHSNPLIAGLNARLSAGLRTPDAARLDRAVPYVYFQQESARCLEVVALVGAEPVRLAPRLGVTRPDRVAARRLLSDVPDRAAYVVLHPGASDPRRRWPPDRFAAVGDYLAGRGLRVVLTGGPDEAPTVAAVRDAMSRPALDLAGRTDLGALVGILAGARLVVSNDTGPMHLAIAVATPTVGIYWVGNLVNGGPLTRALHRPVVSWRTHCPTCGLDCTQQRCQHLASFAADALLEEVVAAADELLGEGVSGLAAGAHLAPPGAPSQQQRDHEHAAERTGLSQPANAGQAIDRRPVVPPGGHLRRGRRQLPRRGRRRPG